MRHNIFYLIALAITALFLWLVKEVKEMSDSGLLSNCNRYE